MRKTFTLEIELGNEAMRHKTDIETALQAVARKFHGPGLIEDDGGRIFDENGNKVGHWSSDEVEPEDGDET